MMDFTPRAAGQLRALEPDITARILDRLRDQVIPDRASLIEVKTAGGTVRCFVARHRDGSLVLLSIVHLRQGVSP